VIPFSQNEHAAQGVEHLQTSQDPMGFSNAFNTVDRREIASGLHRFAPASTERANGLTERRPTSF
jgi:hypothetical protein